MGGVTIVVRKGDTHSSHCTCIKSVQPLTHCRHIVDLALGSACSFSR